MASVTDTVYTDGTYRNPEPNLADKGSRRLRLYNKREIELLQKYAGEAFRLAARHKMSSDCGAEALKKLDRFFWETIPLMRDMRLTSGRTHMYLCRAVQLWRERIAFHHIDYRLKEELELGRWALKYIQDEHPQPPDDVRKKVLSFRERERKRERDERERACARKS